MGKDVFDRSEGEHDEAECGVGGVEAVGPVDDEPDPPVQALVPGIVHAEADCSQDALPPFADGFGQRDEGFQSAALCSRAEPVEESANLVFGEVACEDRPEGLLQGISPPEVASDICGVSGRAMLEALISGQSDPMVLADLAKRRLRSKIPELTEALASRFGGHHAFLARVHLNLIDQHTKAIDELTARIEVVVEPFRHLRDLIITIPGISTTVADVVIAETGADMSRFPTSGHLASWAGTCPGSNESAGRVKSTRTRPGNCYLKGALGVAAMAVAGSKNTYLAAKYRRIAARRGPVKAIVAVEHAMLIAIWNMLSNGTSYCDGGGDYFTRLTPDRARTRAVDQLRKMRYAVTLEPLAEAV